MTNTLKFRTQPEEKNLAPFRYSELWLAALVSMFFVLVVDLITNNAEPTRYGWDNLFYLRMAEQGTHAGLVSPFAYRYGTPLLAAVLAKAFHISVVSGFHIVAFVGGVAELTAIYGLARYLGFQRQSSVIATAFVGLSCFNLKFLMFDPYRPDSLAHPLMVAGFIAAMENRYILCTLISVVGLQFREFLVIPPIVWAVAGRKSESLLRHAAIAAPVFAAVALAVFIPRRWIPVVMTLPPGYLFYAARFVHRDVNFVYCLVAYCLPVLLFANGKRMRQAWIRLKPHQGPLLAYTALVLIIGFLGGSDIMRYDAYLFIPLALWIAAILDENTIHPIDAGYALLACTIFNRIPFWIPLWDLDAYLDFYGGWDGRVNKQTALRVLEIGVWLAGAMLLRYVRERKTLVSTRTPELPA